MLLPDVQFGVLSPSRGIDGDHMKVVPLRFLQLRRNQTAQADSDEESALRHSKVIEERNRFAWQNVWV